MGAKTGHDPKSRAPGWPDTQHISLLGQLQSNCQQLSRL